MNVDLHLSIHRGAADALLTSALIAGPPGCPDRESVI